VPQWILDLSTYSEEERVVSSVQQVAASEQPVPLYAADPGDNPIGDSRSSSFKADTIDRFSGELVVHEPLIVGHVAQALGDQEDRVVRVEQDKESSNEAVTQAPHPPAGYFVVELSEGGPQGVRVLENVEAADVEGTHVVGLSSRSLGCGTDSGLSRPQSVTLDESYDGPNDHMQLAEHMQDEEQR
jgi:hypothetical protein